MMRKLIEASGEYALASMYTCKYLINILAGIIFMLNILEIN
jgi:hypothetical protein